jgi:hypothetical protein
MQKRCCSAWGELNIRQQEAISVTLVARDEREGGGSLRQRNRARRRRILCALRGKRVCAHRVVMVRDGRRRLVTLQR